MKGKDLLDLYFKDPRKFKESLVDEYTSFRKKLESIIVSGSLGGKYMFEKNKTIIIEAVEELIRQLNEMEFDEAKKICDGFFERDF